MVKKVTKKKNRRLRRQIRKTVGALTMASAIAIAAIPVPDARAEDPVVKADDYDYAGLTLHKDGKKIYITSGGVTGNWQSTVPILPSDTQIYADPTVVAGYDIVFYYAVPSNNVAVILGADVYSLPTGNNGNYLQIPEEFVTCQAYNESGDYCAVNVDNQFLYYQKEDDMFTVPGIGLIPRSDENLLVKPGESKGIYYHKLTDGEGGQIITQEIEATLTADNVADYFPCYRQDYEEWKDKTLYWYDISYDSGIGTISLLMDEGMYINDMQSTEPPTPTPSPTVTDGLNQDQESTASPNQEPTQEPTVSPEQEPTQEPTASPDQEPTKEPITSPTKEPTEEPTAIPTEVPVVSPEPKATGSPDKSSSASNENASDETSQTAENEDTVLDSETITYTMDNSIRDERNIVIEPKAMSLRGGLIRNYLGTNVVLEKQHFRPVTGANTYLTVAVRYIGQQYLKDKLDSAGKKTGEKEIDNIVTSDNKRGVFAGLGINELRTGENLVGIGDYAFFNCSSLRSIMVNRGVNNGLTTIGNGAFAYCTNLAQCDLMEANNLQVIGMDTFLRCRSLKNFQLPTGVKAIGDYCFMGCDGLETITFNDGLSYIGYDAFVDCSALSSLTFPTGYVEKLPINYFKGCTNIQYIKMQNEQCDIIDGQDSAGESTNHNQYGNDPSCDIDEFVKALNWNNFYLEGPHTNNSSIYETAKDHSISFKYVIDNVEYYEKVEVCPEPAQHPISYVIRVENGQESLAKPILDRQCKELVIPSNIGSHFITAIDNGCFAGYCNLESVTIPSSVSFIDTNAFQGCHRLKSVIFEHSADNPLEIRDNAFNTQDISLGHQECQEDAAKPVNGDKRLEYEPKLAFTGPISPTFGAFTYAMKENNNYNNASQAVSYITYYSGWPTNLEVKYNPDNPEGQRNELVGYPTYQHIYVGYKEGDYPYLTAEMIADAKEAVTQGGGSGYYQSILDAGKKVNVPAGVDAIKTGLFSGKKKTGQPLDGNPDPDKDITSITLNTVKEVEPYAFVGCESLESFYYDGSGLTGSIGDYAFKDCDKLSNVEIGPGVASMGIRPFGGCANLPNVNFVNNPNFVCDKQIIFGTADGTKTSIVECLETRGGAIGSEELEGVGTIQEEAFKNCDNVRSIDLSGTAVTTIPRQAFSQMDRLGIIRLPSTATNVSEGAFWNTPDLYEVTISNDRMTIAADAFALVEEEKTANGKSDIKLVDGKPVVYAKGDPNARKDNEISFICSNDSVASNYAKDIYYIETVEVVQVRYYVTPQGVDNARPVLVGQPVSIPVNILEDPIKWAERKLDYEPDLSNAARYPEYQYPGYIFQNWSDYEETQDGYLESYAVYERVEEECIINFVDVKNTAQGMVTIKVPSGTRLTEEQIPEPADKEHFIEWSADAGVDISIKDRIYEDVTFYARYSDIQVTPTPTNDPNASPSVNPSGSPGASPSGNPNPGGSPGASITPSASPSGGNNNDKDDKDDKPTATPTATPTPSNGNDVVKYTVSVSGGSGSGQYAAGTVVAINAYYRGEGQLFDRWTTSTAGVGFANPESPSTTFTMPAANVAITATYKTGGAGSAATTTSGGGNGGNTVTGSTSNNNGTTVDITRPGISNRNLAGATVSGATDNFVVKVTEDQAATDAATSALQARFGDLSRIKYFPMDISLYDSTGRTKIADTSGISVNLTLPLPDELVQYAGNNKIAAISGGALEDLNARFTTIDGVPCINFTATHFSPYVIYVDTANLTEAAIDATPKTGDPIHPKWFLALGMACLSLILFFKRDRVVINTKTA